MGTNCYKRLKTCCFMEKKAGMSPNQASDATVLNDNILIQYIYAPKTVYLSH